MNPRKLSALLYVVSTAILCLGVLLLAVRAGRADHAPQLLPDGSIVHGDWGLYRPGHMAPWVEGPVVISAPRGGLGQYFPTNRDDPGAYRRRPPVDRVPIPPEPYYRSWGVQSQNLDPNSATVYAPFDPPAVIYAPEIYSKKK
ncbi:MAG: hypothetical protein IT539_01765 [Bradyrhizobiaceae bacterium]|nr:hypothetical protein [Bradyrhizobiaceae bacterium]